jgi:hypothetical protein
MKYGDFSSLVQLGAGLHIGTALLQIYGEFGMQPLVRMISRIRSLVPRGIHSEREGIEEDLSALESDFEIFQIRLFKEYETYVKINSIVAVLLVIALTVIAYKADDEIATEMAVAFVALSIFPAPITLFAFWVDAAAALGPIKKRADELEKRSLKRR